LSEQKKSADVKALDPYRRCQKVSSALMHPPRTQPANRTLLNQRGLRQFVLAILTLTACRGEPPPDTWVGYPRILGAREDIWRCWKLHEIGGEVVFLRTGGNDSTGVAGTGSGPPRELPEVQVLMVPVERNDSIYTPIHPSAARWLNVADSLLAQGMHEDSVDMLLRGSNYPFNSAPFNTVADLRAYAAKFPSSMRIPSSMWGFLGATHVIRRSTGSLYFYNDDDPEAGSPIWHTYTAYRSACPDELAEEAMERIREGA